MFFQKHFSNGQMPITSMRKVGEEAERNTHELLAQSAILERLAEIYDEKTVLKIAHTHGLSTFYK